MLYRVHLAYYYTQGKHVKYYTQGEHVNYYTQGEDVNYYTTDMVTFGVKQ
jgi:hypothetical protein